ncbi:transcription accessory protein [Salmonella enterica subsp. arizonae]|nr:transcription accessory protein [Salmonella enterica subsp. arizonae]
MMNDSFCRIIAGEIQAHAGQVEAAVRLLDEGNTVPFIARYRKEITGGLDDTQLRNLETRLGYLRELEDRRQAILKSISEQGKLTDELANAINGTLSKTSSKTSTCPINLNAALVDKSPLKPALSRWPIFSGMSRPTILT